jgi:hypothetical protein
VECVGTAMDRSSLGLIRERLAGTTGRNGRIDIEDLGGEALGATLTISSHVTAVPVPAVSQAGR